MSNAPVVLVVEGDIVVRHPLAEYLRECGFVVLEASTADEAKEALNGKQGQREVGIVLADLTSTDDGFDLVHWIRTSHREVDVLTAGSLERVLAHAGGLCEDEGPASRKPPDHRVVLDHIRRLVARRERD